jgi:CCR4-NOT transcription complex subunit 4
MKKLQQSKLLKSKINKQLETLGRRHLRDVRIVIKNMVYVVGMKMPPGSGSGEEVSFDGSSWLRFFPDVG